MKKYLLTFILSISIFGFNSKAEAGFYSSSYFEPVMGCVIGGAAGYATSTENQAMNAGLYCAGGIVLGMVLNSYYRSKVDAVYEREIAEREMIVKQKVVKQANRANLGLTDQYYSIEAEQIEESQQLEDGSIISPTKRVLLKAP